jgi:hypothetical protein
MFSKVYSLLPDDLDDGLRAREETAWCQCQIKETETGIASLQAVLETLTGLEGRNFDTARCLWRLGKANWDLGGKLFLVVLYRIWNIVHQIPNATRPIGTLLLRSNPIRRMLQHLHRLVSIIRSLHLHQTPYGPRSASKRPSNLIHARPTLHEDLRRGSRRIENGIL